MKVSVITPSFNQGQFFEETIQSVLSQTHNDIEMLVLDGGSTDNSVQILEKYQNRLWYRSEKDDGQTAAINEGFQRATGEILTWLNSDDLFYDELTLAKVSTAFESDQSIDAIYGDFIVIDHEGIPLVVRKQTGFDYRALLYGFCYITPAIFVRRRALERWGLLDESFRYSFDWEYYLRLGKNNANIRQLKHFLFRHRFHQESISVGAPEKQQNEVNRIIELYHKKWILSSKFTDRLIFAILQRYYRGKRWLLSLLLRGNISIPFSSKWVHWKIKR